MYKKFILFMLSVFSIFFWGFSNVSAQEDKIYFFYGNGCPHCENVISYFEQNDIYSKYRIENKEIYFDRDNAILFNKMLDDLGEPVDSRGVPTLIIGDRVMVGDRVIIDNFEKYAFDYIVGGENLNQESGNEKNNQTEDARVSYDLTILAVLGASLVDAINPCAFAVLIILMSTIIAGGGGKRALKTGLAFSLSIFISYFLMGLGLYKALGLGSISSVFFRIVGWLAVFLGFANLKDYFWYGRGFLMEVPLSWRPFLKKTIRSVTSPMGAFGVGFLVSLILLPCTSGPYVVILGMLAEKVYLAKAILYLFIYNLVFVLPMVLITIAVYRGFSPDKAEKMRKGKLRTLHLVAGLIMIAMGVVILAGWL